MQGQEDCVRPVEVQTTESDILPILTLEKGPRVRGSGELGGRTKTPRHHFFEQPKAWGLFGEAD